jgi:hypothetical protein
MATMDLRPRLRAYAINDLQRFCSSTHYLLRDHDPVADCELTQPLLEKSASLGLTPRELAAAHALNDLATYEIRSRSIWAAAFPVRDVGSPPVESDMTENQKRELSARLEIHRRSALVYARTVNDPLLVEYFQPDQQTAVRPQAATADSTHGEAPSVSPLQDEVAGKHSSSFIPDDAPPSRQDPKEPRSNASELLTPDTGNWKMQIQSEATRMFKSLRNAGAQPKVHSIIDDLAKWCRNNNVKTASGVYPSAGYIRTHVLSGKHWTPPNWDSY